MRISDWSSDVCSSDLYTYQSAWFLRGFDAGVRGTSEPQEARIGTMGGRIVGPCPTGASAAGRSPAEKDKGRQGPGHLFAASHRRSSDRADAPLLALYR